MSLRVKGNLSLSTKEFDSSGSIKEKAKSILMLVIEHRKVMARNYLTVIPVRKSIPKIYPFCNQSQKIWIHFIQKSCCLLNRF